MSTDITATANIINEQKTIIDSVRQEVNNAHRPDFQWPSFD